MGWPKECRWVGTRFDKLAGNFIALVRLAFIQRYLRLLDPSDKTHVTLLTAPLTTGSWGGSATEPPLAPARASREGRANTRISLSQKSDPLHQHRCVRMGQLTCSLLRRGSRRAPPYLVCRKLTLKIIRDIWRILGPAERRALLLMCMLSIASAVLELVGVGLVVPVLAIVADPGIAAKVAAEFPSIAPWIPADQSRLLVHGLIVLLVAYLLKAGCQLAVSWSQASFVYRSEANLSIRLLETYLRQPWAFHLQRNSAELAATIRAEPYAMSFLLMSGVTLISDTVAVTGLVALMAVIEPAGTFAVAGLLALSVVGFFVLVKGRLAGWGVARQTFDVLRQKHMQESIGSVREIQLLGCEAEFVGRYRSAMLGYARVVKRASFVQSLPRVFLELLALASLGVLVAVLVSQGKSTVEMLPLVGMFAAAATRLMPSFNRALGAAQTIRGCLPALKKIASELALVSPGGAHPDVRRDGTLGGHSSPNELRLESVCFRYENSDRPALSEVSLVIPHGQMVGVIGTSGSGKSTLMDLLLGLLKPSSGRIFFGGADVLANLSDWRSRIGYVPQTIVLTDASLRENVAFGVARAQIDDSAVRRALSLARLDDLVAHLPAGLDTEIGERGARLSGGQRQRIGIARALYRDPSILVLDEATSALDGRTEQGVMEAINALQGQKTLIIVAHRLTTVERCDRIIRLEGGRVVDDRTQVR